ncbi:S9 family peptidase [Rhizorhabdus dicambivorans]|uniref:S9 family peptidase n=2 Tax=Rhizorhabdus dicambivorans TaxID=1850238 RepID=A0A2A4FTS4_9SPHN|nr:S9 family peptidase [Rhizorhabdus dicambivorans]PCE41130.1 S9 family peptidase [Rhizorhabdus dicambivorans]
MDLYRDLRGPGAARISDAREFSVHPGGRRALFAGVMALYDGHLVARIYEIDLQSGVSKPVGDRPAAERLPRYSPDGKRFAYLADAAGSGNYQLVVGDAASGVVAATPVVPGWVEDFRWSPDGTRIAMVVAGHGADRAGADGAIATLRAEAPPASWAPRIETEIEPWRWRRAWIHECDGRRSNPVGPDDLNIWELDWLGGEALAVVASPGAGEGLWYSAGLTLVPLDGAPTRELHRPVRQIGCLAGSLEGRSLAFVEALCSDRKIIAGDLHIRDDLTGAIRSVGTHGVDVGQIAWRPDGAMIVAGQRGAETVVARLDPDSGVWDERWSSDRLSTGGYYPAIAPFGESGDCVLVGEGFFTPPEIAIIEDGRYRVIVSLDLGGSAVPPLPEAILVEWTASDGLAIDGWLIRPPGDGPHPLIMVVHGGPIWQSRPRWLGRSPYLLALSRAGYALFFPNPRGSNGKGQGFAERVLGDLCGADAEDCRSGLDLLIESGIADPDRLGVTGTSYGGMQSYHLVTVDDRFSAAVAVSPIANLHTQQALSNIPEFVELFLANALADPRLCTNRSPVTRAAAVRTPMLSICGALDRCTPPEEARQFHDALVRCGRPSTLVIYPEEGHGVHGFPAIIDFTARLSCWFDDHMPVSRPDQRGHGAML